MTDATNLFPLGIDLVTEQVERLRTSGMFGAAVEAPEGSGPTEQLMAFLVRVRPQ